MAKNLSLTDTVTIANGATTSAAIAMQASRIPLAILIPAAMTGTAITFQASPDGGANYFPIFLESTLYSVAVPTAATRHIALDRRAFEGVRLVRLVSNATELALRTIGVISGE